VKFAGEDGDTPLHFAATEETSLLSSVIRNGADVNAANVHGCTPLHQAAFKNYLPNFSENAIKELLKAGANVDCRDNERKYTSP